MPKKKKSDNKPPYSITNYGHSYANTTWTTTSASTDPGSYWVCDTDAGTITTTSANGTVTIASIFGAGATTSTTSFATFVDTGRVHTFTPARHYLTLEDVPSHTHTYVDGTSLTGTYGFSYAEPALLFENDIISIGEKGEVMINGKVELNPTKIGKALLQALEKHRKDDLNDPKDFFNKD